MYQPTNEDRAYRAAAALTNYHKAYEDADAPVHQVVRDLIADLGHYADWIGEAGDGIGALQLGREHYEAEVEEEQED